MQTLVAQACGNALHALDGSATQDSSFASLMWSRDPTPHRMKLGEVIRELCTENSTCSAGHSGALVLLVSVMTFTSPTLLFWGKICFAT